MNRVVAIVLLALLTTACGGDRSSQVGEVVGYVATAGGDPPGPGQSDIRSAANLNVDIRARRTDGTVVVRHLRTDAKGLCRFSLPHGRYTMTVRLGNTVVASIERWADVRSGRVARMRFLESIK
ncbi:MAG: hypothetical protein QOI39_1227 [Mycobacterium sp.]|nr:hypothetical protein [Mycobacterium sp.]